MIELPADTTTHDVTGLTDLYYPGWRVYVDGHEEEIHRTNAIFRGVELDPGSHRVVYRFEPTSFYIGSWMFTITILCIAAATLSSYFNRPLGSPFSRETK